MQKLIYQNIYGQQAVFLHKPYVLCKLRGMGLSDVDVKAFAGAYQDGESVTGLLRDGRKVKLTLHLMADSRQEMYRLRSELIGILSPDLAFDGENRARLIYENDFGRWWTWAVPEKGLDWGDRKQNVHPSVTLTFRCESPYWFSVGKNVVDFRARDNGLTFAMTFPFKLGSKRFQQNARNDGQAETPVEITIWGKGEKPTLVNERTGAKIKLISQLPTGDVLRVNTDPAALNVTIAHADGTVESGYGLLDPETSIAGFTLRAGDNPLRYAPDGDGSATVIQAAWYDRYEGV